VLQIGRNKFYNQKNKILKIPEFKRSRIRIIAESCGILSRFLNQVSQLACDCEGIMLIKVCPRSREVSNS
jgi:hypothetical protein